MNCARKDIKNSNYFFLGLKYADGVVPGQGSPDHAEEKEEEEDEVSPPPSTAEQK